MCLPLLSLTTRLRIASKIPPSLHPGILSSFDDRLSFLSVPRLILRNSDRISRGSSPSAPTPSARKVVWRWIPPPPLQLLPSPMPHLTWYSRILILCTSAHSGCCRANPCRKSLPEFSAIDTPFPPPTHDSAFFHVPLVSVNCNQLWFISGARTEPPISRVAQLTSPSCLDRRSRAAPAAFLVSSSCHLILTALTFDLYRPFYYCTLYLYASSLRLNPSTLPI